MVKELKNCPFCGGKAELEEATGLYVDENGKDINAWQAKCSVCNLSLVRPLKEQVIHVWNKKYVEEKELKHLRNLVSYARDMECKIEYAEFELLKGKVLEEKIKEIRECKDYFEKEGDYAEAYSEAQLEEWLRELEERRQKPEITYCRECINRPECPWTRTEEDYCSRAQKRRNNE